VATLNGERILIVGPSFLRAAALCSVLTCHTLSCSYQVGGVPRFHRQCRGQEDRRRLCHLRCKENPPRWAPKRGGAHLRQAEDFYDRFLAGNDFAINATAACRATRRIKSRISESRNPKTGKPNRRLQTFFLFLSYSHVAYLDYGGVPFRPFPRRCPRDGGTLQAFRCPPPRPVP
jgi:hypothetical protein